jgi:hypothetical protein
MANETTSSTVSTRALSYVLGAEALPANIADLVAIQLCNDDDINGQPSMVKQYAVESDLGAASAGTEGTAIATNTALSYGSAITGTVVEGALVMSTITDRSVEVQFPGGMDIHDLMQRGSFDQQLAALQPSVNRLGGMCFEKMESDVVALLTGLSTSVGTTGVDFTVDDAFTALFTYDTLEAVNRNNAWLLTSVQMNDLRRDLAVAGGGLGGAVWFQQADASILANGTLPKNGYKGTFMGRPVYQYSHSLRVLSDTSANVNGGLIAIGSGAPDVGGGANLGAFGLIRRGGLKVRLDYRGDERGCKVVVSLEYVAIEVRDSHGVRIKTDA